MKFIIAVLTCILSSYSYAKNNPVDLKIGGIALFDNLYDHLTPLQVREKKKDHEDYYKHLKNPYKFPTLIFNNHPTINQKYKSVEINYKNVDEQLIVHSIRGLEFYSKIDFCYKDLKSLVEYISQRYSTLRKSGPDIMKHPADSRGESQATRYFFVDKKYIIRIGCMDWSKRITRIKRWTDNLSYAINSNEFSVWTTETK